MVTLHFENNLKRICNILSQPQPYVLKLTFSFAPRENLLLLIIRMSSIFKTKPWFK